MRISGKPSVSGSSPASPSRMPSSAPAPVATTPLSAADAVSVSGTAQLIALAEAEAALVPEIRTEKVEALKAAIDSDRYHPDGEAVADGIVREHAQFRSAPDVSS